MKMRIQRFSSVARGAPAETVFHRCYRFTIFPSSSVGNFVLIVPLKGRMSKGSTVPVNLFSQTEMFPNDLATVQAVP